MLRPRKRLMSFINYCLIIDSAAQEALLRIHSQKPLTLVISRILPSAFSKIMSSFLSLVKFINLQGRLNIKSSNFKKLKMWLIMTKAKKNMREILLTISLLFRSRQRFSFQDLLSLLQQLPADLLMLLPLQFPTICTLGDLEVTELQVLDQLKI